VCVLGIRASCTHPAELIEMPLEEGELTYVDARNRELDGGQDRDHRVNPFTTVRGYKTAMWPFVKLLCKLVTTTITAAAATTVLLHKECIYAVSMCI